MKRIISIIFAVALLSSMPLAAQLDRSKAPEPGPAPKVEFGNFNKFTLDNGLKVIVVEDHDRPVISYSINFLTDPYVEGEKAGLSQIYGMVWEKGTKTRTAEELSDEVDFYGGNIWTGAGSIGFYSLKKFENQMLGIITDILYNPTFPEEELDKVRDNMLGGLKMQKTNPSAILSNIKAATVYGPDHAYGDIITEATVAAITADDLKAYHSQNILPNNAIMVITGDITLKQAKKQCKQYFSAWKSGNVVKREWPLGRKPQGIEVIFSPKDGAVQSSISMMTPIDIKPGAPDFLALQMANNIYGGGGFSAKLMKNLREDKGYTYGAYSSVSTDRFSGSFEASSEVNANATDSSFIEMRKELENMLKKDYTDRDLAQFKAMSAGSFSRSLESSSSIANYAFSMERNNLPEDYYSSYLQRLDAVTRADVDAAVAKYFDPENMYYFVVGDPSILPVLRKLDSDGVVVELDFEGKPIEKKEIAADVTAESIIANYIEKIGGRELLESVTDATTVMEMSVMGMSMTTTTKVLPAAKAFSSVQSMGGTPMVSMVLKDGVLEVSQGGMTQKITDQAQLEAMTGDNLTIFKELTAEYELAGIETVDGKDAYKLKYESAGAVAYEFYDVATGMKIRTVSTAEGQTMESTYVEYAESKEGIKYPSVMKMTLPQVGEVDVKVSMEFNTGLTVNNL